MNYWFRKDEFRFGYDNLSVKWQATSRIFVEKEVLNTKQ